MKFYIAYKFRGADKEKLRQHIKACSEAIEASGHETFCYFRDIMEWKEKTLPAGKVIKQGFEELENTDALLVIINSREKSTGMLLEIGYAEAKNKKIVIAEKEGVEFPTLESIADKSFNFETTKDLKGNLKKVI